ncbi:MAG: hypothetical protein FWC89_14375 [Defluviitaleaceae bacterium]|nr:hypothetical protein [Defluviitaleaceae bacterium]
MKVGDYVTVQEIANQSECRWVVLTDFAYGEYDSIEGGIVRYIANTKTEAGNAAYELEQDEETYALVVSGASLSSVIVGGLFVE